MSLGVWYNFIIILLMINITYNNYRYGYNNLDQQHVQTPEDLEKIKESVHQV